MMLKLDRPKKLKPRKLKRKFKRRENSLLKPRKMKKKLPKRRKPKHQPRMPRKRETSSHQSLLLSEHTQNN